MYENYQFRLKVDLFFQKNMVLDAFCSASLAKKKSKIFEILEQKIGEK